jgi:hypothetical protein
MNLRLRWRFFTTAVTWSVIRSIPASRLTVQGACIHDRGRRSRAVPWVAHRTQHQLVEACVARRRSVLANLAGQEPRRTQLVGGPWSFAFQQVSDATHALASVMILGSVAETRTIVERQDRTDGTGPLNTPLAASPHPHRRLTTQSPDAVPPRLCTSTLRIAS